MKYNEFYEYLQFSMLEKPVLKNISFSNPIFN